MTMSSDQASISRRAILATGAAGLLAVSLGPVRANSTGETVMTQPSQGEETLPQGVRSRVIHGVNGLDVRVLEGGHDSLGRPLALLLHGFPDLAYGWRHLIPILA